MLVALKQQRAVHVLHRHDGACEAPLLPGRGGAPPAPCPAPQKRFSCTPGTWANPSAAKVAALAMLDACSREGSPQPRMTSATCAGWKPLRSRRAFSTPAASPAGGTSWRPLLPRALTGGVRAVLWA